MTLQELYERAKNKPSDIHEHIEWLYALAKDPNVHHITEMGSRTGVSTTALLLGLQAHNCGLYKMSPSLITYDLEIQPEIMKLFQMREDVRFVPNKESTLEIDPIEETDLLFIDTDHNYDQLIQELTIHGNQSRKWIAMHDTETYKMIGDPPTKAGLWPAIEEFLQMNPHWKIKEVRKNNNGMTLLERI